MRPMREVLAERAKAERERDSGMQLAAELLGPRKAKAKRSPPAITDKVWAKLTEEVAARARTGAWEGTDPKEFVALYAAMHLKVYGVACAELDKGVRFLVSVKARGMLEQQFGGDAAEMAAFVRWTWQREEWKEKNGKNEGGWRVTPWQQFNGKILTDYRLDLARKHRRTGT